VVAVEPPLGIGSEPPDPSGLPPLPITLEPADAPLPPAGTLLEPPDEDDAPELDTTVEPPAVVALSPPLPGVPVSCVAGVHAGVLRPSAITAPTRAPKEQSPSRLDCLI
jgi:hypothetical protein